MQRLPRNSCTGARARNSSARARATATATAARRRATTHTHTTVRVRSTAILSKVGSRCHAGVTRDINSSGNPGKDTVLELVTQENILHEGVDRIGFLGENVVLAVGSDVLGVGAVGFEFLNLGDEILIEEELANPVRVRSVDAADGVVFEDLGFVCGVGEDYVDVRDWIMQVVKWVIPWM